MLDVRLPELPRHRPLGAIGVLASSVVLALCLGDSSAMASPWRTTSFDAALRDLRRDQLLVVELGAEWCEPCNQLAMEVLDTPEAAELLGRDVGLRIDFESDEGQDLKRRYGILSLPTLLFIHREGFEIGRVEGFPGRAEWLEAARDVRRGQQGLEALEAAVKARPDDDSAALDFAQALLVRRKSKDALATLDTLISRSPSSPDIVARAARAARIKGRWLLRVNEDAKTALAHFSEMVERFKLTPHEDHFTYWTAESQEALGNREAALETFAAWRERRPNDPDLLLTQAGFMVHHEYPPDAITRVILDCTPSAQTSYLLARVGVRLGKLEAARTSIADAVARDPGNALFQNWRRRIEALR
jgi:tetratricopeptide (TPR) repeat protein